MRGGRDRPRRIYRATAPRAPLAHHHARDSSFQGRHRRPVQREARHPLHRRARGADRASRASACARFSSAPRWASPASTSRSPKPARWCWSKTKATDACRARCPEIFVAVMGIEKVIPRLADLRHFLEVLARTATGQKLTTYTNFISGPRRNGEIDGPREMHVVMLDNGRSAMLADPVLREALYCLRCGACLNVCPVYRRIGGHAYGSPYPGPIGSIVSPEPVRQRGGSSAVRFDAVRRLPRYLPGQDRYPADPAASALEGRRRRRWPTGGAVSPRRPARPARPQSLRADGASSTDDAYGLRSRRVDAPAVRARRMAPPDARSLSQLDQYSRLSRASRAALRSG